MPEITQLSGHRGAQCSSRWAVASSLVLGVPRQVSSSPFVPFPLPLLCPSPVSLPVPLISFSCGLWASLSHFPPPPTPPLSFRLICNFVYGAIGNLGIQRAPELVRCPAVCPCPSALWLQQEGWAKGREWRPQQPNLEQGLSSGSERNEETSSLGREGAGVSERAKAARGCKLEPLPAL